MKQIIATVAAIFGLLFLSAQPTETLTLDGCYILAQENYPLFKQRDLIGKSKAYNIDNAKMGYLPQVNISAQATYQSDVTKIALPPSVPITIEPPNKDQYKLYGEVNQSLTDAFLIEPQRKLALNRAEVEQQKLEVDLYQLKERVNQLYFGILLIDGQEEQVEILKRDLQSGIDKISAAIKNGVAYKSNLSELRAELLKADQRTIELKATRKAYVDMLGQFINRELTENTKLESPTPVLPSLGLNRPELSFFDLQKKTLDTQDKLVVAKTLPRAGVFFQGGYANPALNFLKNEFAGYYITGIRFGWSLGGFYTLRKDKKLLDVNRSLIDIQRETFLFNTNFALKQQNAELDKLNDLIKSDDEIIGLREEVKNAAKAQLENGVITSSDFLTKLNAEDQARQNRLIHHIQLLMAQYNYKTTSGN
ncbi:MAG: TolC family protein [Bacteroidetes bacterium]|nr:TolC family protein [Bacteroidota bacterium]